MRKKIAKKAKPVLKTFEIKNQWDDSIIYKDEAESFEALILAAVKEKTNLAGAYLAGAYLAGAYLTGANLTDAYLTGAYLAGAIGIYPIVPEEGSFTGFKKLANGTIAKILIPEDAERVGGYTGRKCRASKAIVIDGTGFSKHDSKFEYVPGKTVIPDSWDNDPRIECSNGIHFFLTRKEAEAY